MQAYRFKNANEFTRIHGDDWRNALEEYWNSNMDRLLGQKLTDDENMIVWDAMEDNMEENDSEELNDIDSIYLRGERITGDMLYAEGNFVPKITKRFRFRTEKEFQKEYNRDGSDEEYDRDEWRECLDGEFGTDMDYLLGRVLDDEENLRAKRAHENGCYMELDGYEIYEDMLIEMSGSGASSFTPLTLSEPSSLNVSLFKRKPRVRLTQDN